MTLLHATLSAGENVRNLSDLSNVSEKALKLQRFCNDKFNEIMVTSSEYSMFRKQMKQNGHLF